MIRAPDIKKRALFGRGHAFNLPGEPRASVGSVGQFASTSWASTSDMDVDHSTVSATTRATIGLLETYQCLNPRFRYNTQHNPRRVLTKPSERRDNHGFDNAEADYILYVNDSLGSNVSPSRYQIVDLLGKGTFGQVVKCLDLETNDYVAIKIVKNLPAYHNQGLVEVRILELLNSQFDTETYPMVKLLDKFVFRNHLCLVMELLNVSLFELIRQNQFKGLSLKLISLFVKQILQCMCALHEARIMHCDLKPENILLEDATGPNIKVIDFGSAAIEGQSVYSYIQSRFYRSPEVILGLPYRLPIDVWSLGCICFELFVGLPLFPGVNQHRMLMRFIRFLNMPPVQMLNEGKEVSKFFNRRSNTGTIADWVLKTDEEYARAIYEQQVAKARATGAAPPSGPASIPPFRDYFKASSIVDIVLSTEYKSHLSKKEREDELNVRHALLHFLEKTLQWDPEQRWIPSELLQHPFVTGEKFSGDFLRPRPTSSSSPMSSRSPSMSPMQSNGYISSPTEPYSTPSPAGAVRERPASTRRRSQPYQRPTKLPATASGIVSPPSTFTQNSVSHTVSNQPSTTIQFSQFPASHQPPAFQQQSSLQQIQLPYQQIMMDSHSSSQSKKRRHSFAARSQQNPYSSAQTGPSSAAPSANQGEDSNLFGFVGAASVGATHAYGPIQTATSARIDDSAMVVDTSPGMGPLSAAMLGTTPSAGAGLIGKGSRGRRRAQSEKDDVVWSANVAAQGFQTPGRGSRWPATSPLQPPQGQPGFFRVQDPLSPSQARRSGYDLPDSHSAESDMNWPMDMDDTVAGPSGTFISPEDWDPLFSETELLDNGSAPNQLTQYYDGAGMDADSVQTGLPVVPPGRFLAPSGSMMSGRSQPVSQAPRNAALSASLGTSPGGRLPNFGSLSDPRNVSGSVPMPNLFQTPGSTQQAQNFFGQVGFAGQGSVPAASAFVFGFSPYDSAPGQHFPQTASMPFGSTPSGSTVFRSGQPSQQNFTVGSSFADDPPGNSPWAPASGTPNKRSARANSTSRRAANDNYGGE